MEKPSFQNKFIFFKSKFFPAKIPFSKILKKNLVKKKITLPFFIQVLILEIIPGSQVGHPWFIKNLCPISHQILNLKSAIYLVIFVWVILNFWQILNSKFGEKPAVRFFLSVLFMLIFIKNLHTCIP